MNTQDIRWKLVHAVTEYDRKQKAKPHYNIYALPQYLGAVSDVMHEIEKGRTIREALLMCFNGRLLTRCLKAIGEADFTIQEMHSQSLTYSRS